VIVWALGFVACTERCPGAEGLRVAWSSNVLTVSGAQIPGGDLEIWYLEAFCRKGSTHRDWAETKIPHKTRLIHANADQKELRFVTTAGPDVEVQHQVITRADEIELSFQFTNHSGKAVDLEWFQPACIRVARFTGSDQTNYIRRWFIFTERGLTRLADTRRTVEALYRGGQVFVPQGINLNDVNPRPICLDRPTNGLIGCFSADGKSLLATASDKTQELFEGVYVCLHSDPHIGGLGPHESKSVRSRIYIMTNDVAALLGKWKRWKME
jgi:hypothetical protein